MQKVKQKYGIWTGIAMVVGTVIGAGIFIKSSSVLAVCGGNMWAAVGAWLTGGLIMVASGFCFAKYASKITKFNGLVDYVEYASNESFAYRIAYFSGVIYFPLTTANIALLGSMYFLQIFDPSITQASWQVYLVGFVFMLFFTFFNYLSPKIANYFQISSLWIKLVPIVFIVIIGVFGGVIPSLGPGHSFIDPFKDSPASAVVNFGEAVKITSFAYNGWICATALNAEMKDSKKNLPRALVGGTIAVVILYILFFVSLAAILTNPGMIEAKETATEKAFAWLLSDGSAQRVVAAIICISCLGNLNATAIATSRGILAMAMRGQGFIPEKIAKIKGDDFTYMPYLISFVLSLFFMVLWFLAHNHISFFAYLDSMDEIVCALVYGTYIVIYIYMMRKFDDENVFSRYVMPVVAILGSLFFVACGTGIYQLIANKTPDSLYGFLILLAISVLFFIPSEILWYQKHKKKTEK
ncbi:MAG: amino acid permease [Bacilli bacterium]|nr:amino acid permease [Bacilli bacterium]